MPETDFAGLTTSEAARFLAQKGLNVLPESKNVLLKKIFRAVISPISLMLVAASVLSFYQGKNFDGYFILTLLFINQGVTFWQEKKADNAIKKLNENLAVVSTVLRDGKWVSLDSRQIVDGDVVKLTGGQLIPADATTLFSKNASVNESMLTGESLPKEKNKGDKVYSGAFLVSGVLIIKITATGEDTYFGKTLTSVEKVRKQSILEKDIVRVTKFLSILSIIAILFLTFFFIILKNPVSEILQLDLTLLIAGIPISLPTVMTLIIELGVVAMAKKNVIVRRLSSLEDLSNVNYLLTDKTGTITQNKIEVAQAVSYGKFKEEDAIRFAYLVAKNDDNNTVNQSIIRKFQSERISILDYKISNFEPFDLNRKTSSAQVQDEGERLDLMVGAPQEIIKMSIDNISIKNKFNEDVESLAKRGFKSVAVLVDSKIAGLLGFSDTLRPEAKGVLEYLRESGVGVSIVTGDNKAITSEIAKGVALPGKILTKGEIEKIGFDKFDEATFNDTAAFAEVLPDDKFRLVEVAKKYFTVASNGDGINDLPAIKEANVGFAVKNAVDALKSSADIVLLSEGISVIKDAIIEGRKIFARVNTYAMYRISESFRLIITAVVLGFIYKIYPLTPLQIIILALLNDIPIISLAYDRVETTARPAKINVKERFIQSSLFGLSGVANSLILFFILADFLHISWPIMQTIFFLKLTVSGHMLIYNAHTRLRWWKFLPSSQIVWATTLTQILASILAFTGLFMSAPISIWWIVFVWVWAFIWMQITEAAKLLQKMPKRVDMAQASSIP